MPFRNTKPRKTRMRGEIIIYPHRIDMLKIVGGPLELDVLEVLWEDGIENEYGLKATAVHERVKQRAGKSLAITTITTVLGNLCDKKLVEYVETTNPYQMFRATKTRKQFIKYMMRATIIALAKLNRPLFNEVLREVLP